MKNIIKFAKFVCSLITFWRFYKDYGYDGETVAFIIDNYERVLCSRTNTMSKPTYYLGDVLREIDIWYEKRIWKRIIGYEEKQERAH